MKKNSTNNRFLGYQISALSLAELVDESFAAVTQARPQLVFACANPHSLAVAERDGTFRQALLNTDNLVADGVGLVKIARLFGHRLEPRITGTEYFDAVMAELNAAAPRLGRRGRVFFFGSSQRVLDLIKEKVAGTYPDIELCGVLSPPFGAWSEALDQQMIDQINAAHPDVLWVGMTAPKQEKWVYSSRDRLNAPVIGSIGAVFDFFAGTYPRAPRWACRLGLEWVVRLAREPRRMWRRTFISLPRFVAVVFRHYLVGTSMHTTN
jgi:N-acetylglucosaminyldiphosphoundecaprenol N-acetyl-beta-D-mannosaminyltransferase